MKGNYCEGLRKSWNAPWDAIRAKMNADVRELKQDAQPGDEDD